MYAGAWKRFKRKGFERAWRRPVCDTCHGVRGVTHNRRPISSAAPFVLSGQTIAVAGCLCQILSNGNAAGLCWLKFPTSLPPLLSRLPFCMRACSSVFNPRVLSSKISFLFNFLGVSARSAGNAYCKHVGWKGRSLLTIFACAKVSGGSWSFPGLGTLFLPLLNRFINFRPYFVLTLETYRMIPVVWKFLEEKNEKGY